MGTNMFETFEDAGTFFVKGTVYVIAILDRDTLVLKDYVETAFTSIEEAEEVLYQKTDSLADLAYVIQEKEMMIPIYRSER